MRHISETREHKCDACGEDKCPMCGTYESADQPGRDHGTRVDTAVCTLGYHSDCGGWVKQPRIGISRESCGCTCHEASK